ncbi:transcription factor, contains a PHD finger motif [Yamadazyma tenuis]|uniref:B30.2/SPRY domain-containing protein n=1 Tax=Candida tenuis (strain ATCC 10573 / BCRC 21748 / CBS 615 / JCM 9827 / NBRC 10315 / NRRL Y-1498 / VKM Y-70) TaxID=590646 RepID=G3B041_CANTC|nr:uncharacterized protein CANTEDRAFT_113033 [Yamadazyma tenuis ATCC 10573]EGV65310.1 hypothetical protein CANTEDRAFT_113033 [Yamadazyma tenuis ATCC 10573]WEJ95031.1 transcription factor, contains a PHD finger motif [Yamadazyma tenuis]
MEIEPQVKEEEKTEIEVQAPTHTLTKKRRVIVEPRLKPVSYKASDLKVGNSISRTPAAIINSMQFFTNEDNPLNRRGYKYKPCKPNPELKSTMYSTTDLPPYCVRPSYFDKSSGILLDTNVTSVSNTSGWRSIRSNVGVREGKWYFEFKVLSGNDGTGHVRLGVGRREASLEAPIGCDGYGYGIRDVNGQKVTLSRPKPFMDEGFKTGDVMGVLIDLPSLEDHYKSFEQELKAAENKFNVHGNIVRDQIPIKYKSSLYFEQFEFTPIENMTKLLNPIKVIGERLSSFDEDIQLPKIPGSSLKVYKNGKLMGTMFEELFSFLPIPGNLAQIQNQSFRDCDDGTLGYYPMISVYNQAVVEMNAGPEFALKELPQGVRPLCERYDEHVVEQWYFDLVDEVESQYLDGLEGQ